MTQISLTRMTELVETGAGVDWMWPPRWKKFRAASQRWAPARMNMNETGFQSGWVRAIFTFASVFVEREGAGTNKSSLISSSFSTASVHAEQFPPLNDVHGRTVFWLIRSAAAINYTDTSGNETHFFPLPLQRWSRARHSAKKKKKKE